MVDIAYTTLHKRTGEGGWLATPSTPPGSAPGNNSCHIATKLTVVPDLRGVLEPPKPPAGHTPGYSDNLSKTLQRKDISAAGGQTIADMTIILIAKTLQSIGSEDNSTLFWQKVTTLAESVELDEPQLPRSRKRPKIFELGEAEAEFSATVKDHYRRI